MVRIAGDDTRSSYTYTGSPYMTRSARMTAEGHPARRGCGSLLLALLLLLGRSHVTLPYLYIRSNPPQANSRANICWRPPQQPTPLFTGRQPNYSHTVAHTVAHTVVHTAVRRPYNRPIPPNHPTQRFIIKKLLVINLLLLRPGDLRHKPLPTYRARPVSFEPVCQALEVQP